MKRDLSADGKVPPEVVRETLERFNARASERWSETEPDQRGFRQPGSESSMTTARVSRSGDDWEQPTFEEFIDQYRKPDVDSAKLTHEQWPTIFTWHLAIQFITSYSTLHLDCETKADLLYVGEPFDHWVQEQKALEHQRRVKEEQELTEMMGRSHQEYLLQRAEQEAANHQPSNLIRLWRWIWATTDHQVVGAVVALAIIAAVGVAISAVASAF